MLIGFALLLPQLPQGPIMFIFHKVCFEIEYSAPTGSFTRQKVQISTQEQPGRFLRGNLTAGRYETKQQCGKFPHATFEIAEFFRKVGLSRNPTV